MENEIRSQVLKLVSEFENERVSIPFDLMDSTAEVISALREALSDAPDSPRFGALRFIAGTKLAKELIPEIIHAASDIDSDTRYTAFSRLEEIGPERGVIAALVEKLQSNNRERRRLAADVLGSSKFDSGWTEPLAREAIPALLQMLKDDDRTFVRCPAAKVLANLGLLAINAVPALLKAMKDNQSGSWGVQCEAIIAMGKIGPQNGVVKSLIGALNSYQPETPLRNMLHKHAAEALARIGPEDAVIKALLKALRTEDGVIEMVPGGYSTYAGRALSAIGPEPAILTGLVNGLRDRNKLVRRGSAATLGLLRSGAWDAVNPLVDAMNDKDNDVVLACIIALNRIGSTRTSLIPDFRRVPFWETTMDPRVPSEWAALVPALTRLRWTPLVGQVWCEIK